jgi:hypothetical protein
MYHNIQVNLVTNTGVKPFYVHSIEYSSISRTVISLKLTEVYEFAWLQATANHLEALENYLKSCNSFIPVYSYRECTTASTDPSKRIYEDITKYSRIDSLETLPEFYSIVIGKD